MIDEKLRAIYDARVAAVAGADRVSCPSPDQLQRLAEGGTAGHAPNLALLDHVFGCAHCRPEFALLRAVHVHSDDLADVTAARTKTNRVWFSGPRLAIAAGLMMAVGIGAESLRRMSADASADAVRGAITDASDVVVVAPTANAILATDASFVWRRVAGAVAYEVQLLDTTGVVLGTHVTSDTVFTPAADERAKLVAATTFDWFVAARRADGNERRSAVARVRVATERR